MQGVEQVEIPRLKVGRFLVENSRNNKNSHQNTWSSGCKAPSARKVSTNDNLSSSALGRSSSFQVNSSRPRYLGPLSNKPQLEEHGEQKTTLRPLWENPSQQLRKIPMKKEEDVQFEDSGYLSTFGGISSYQHQDMSGVSLPPDWEQDAIIPRNQETQDTDDLDSVYTDAGVTSLLNQSQIKSYLRRRMDGQEDDLYQAVEEKTKTMNKKKRVVMKSGLTNVAYKNISKKKRRFFSDFYTTLLDSSWTISVIMFSASFYGSWLLFGALYFLICYLHGDFLEENLPDSGNDWIPCIQQIDGFASCFLFSLETQHTIGYGSRQTTTQCPDAMIVVSLQAVIGCIIQAFMVGLVFSKLTRPGKRSRTIIFSNHAVINRRNGRLCLIMRIGDLRNNNFVLGTKISLKLLQRRVTQEGEIYQEMENLKVSPDTSGESCIFFVWPLDIVHVIDEDSPFYNLGAADLTKERFELLLVMEGVNETSNMNFHARTSYLPQEIMWGHRFEQMLIYRRDQKKFQVNFSAFHSTYEVDMPICSAKNLDLLWKRRQWDQKTSMAQISPTLMVSPNPSRVSYTDTSIKDDCLSPVSISRANSIYMRLTSQGVSKQLSSQCLPQQHSGESNHENQ
eukprot:GFUD01006803.1.p1 GENE.GFUD01006803.1~~GFUD01006803.1.p1  ORF type:complete len:620 (-),score=147.28 GFUD01006803.1:285-2144(-)